MLLYYPPEEDGTKDKDWIQPQGRSWIWRSEVNRPPTKHNR